MDIATFHASRRYAHVKSERIAFFERGQGSRVAIFVHGVPLNGYHWRNVIERVLHRRRCIAIDLMGLGYTEIGPSKDVSFTAQAHMIAGVLNALEIEKLDLVGNVSGGAIAQIFAVLRSGSIRNSEVAHGAEGPEATRVVPRGAGGKSHRLPFVSAELGQRHQTCFVRCRAKQASFRGTTMPMCAQSPCGDVRP
jgi:pimeloyl-ACP methyl ester carboxylesterase